MSKIITQEGFILKAAEKNKHVKIIGKYINAKEKIDCQCTICGEYFQSTPDAICAGKKHYKCAVKQQTKKRTKTLEQFKRELYEISPFIKITGNYINAKEKIECLCTIHDEYFFSLPTHLLQGKCGCPQCKSNKISQSNKKSHEEFINSVTIKNPDIEVLGPYNGMHKKIEVKCRKCGFIWNPLAGSIFGGTGCPKCFGKYKTTEEFKSEINRINKDIDITGEYIDSKTKISCKCKICNHEWYALPGNLHYSGCPCCCVSRGEKRIMNFLDDKNIAYETQKKYENLVGIKGKPLSYDFYLSNYNLLIEYQGEFHDGTAYQQKEEEYIIQQEHDKRKKFFALQSNIELLEIWYWDYENIEKILERKLC